MITARAMLTRLPPTKSILCLTVSDATVGFAVSDAYLANARPLAPFPSISTTAVADATRALIDEHDVGALAFGLSMHGAAAAAHADRERLACTVTTTRLRCLLNDRIGLDALRHRVEEEPEMWEGVAQWASEARDDAAIPASISATVALNLFLWEHCGGWRNTFG